MNRLRALRAAAVALALADACASPPRVRVAAGVAPRVVPAPVDPCNDTPRRGQPDPVTASAPVATVALPEVPVLPARPDRVHGAYTVWGAVSRLRNRERRQEVTAQPITVEGVIVATNFGDAPACAVHARGIADPDNCSAPVPSFTIADSTDAAARITVMGFASNFAQLRDALVAEGKGNAPVDDEFWGVRIPRPLPDTGARVRVTGHYGVTFTMAASGMVADTVNGILTYASLEYLVPPAAPPVLGPH